ncbi:hypothetical protein V8C86DRAFT_1663330 [Haematococcus lacustris]
MPLCQQHFVGADPTQLLRRLCWPPCQHKRSSTTSQLRPVPCYACRGQARILSIPLHLWHTLRSRRQPTSKEDITKKRPHLLLGVIMDSPTTNRAALKILAEQHPTWICITCIVHALNLLCKDLANNSRRSEKHTEVGRVLKEVQQIAKTLGDCHKISSALDTAQLEVYGELRGVSAHIDTRFAILFTICKDIRRSKDALRNMRESGNWAKVSAGSANHACFDVVLDRCWTPLTSCLHVMEFSHCLP